jgi:23S rRNA (adenine2503-C2)-methyltransferase
MGLILDLSYEELKSYLEELGQPGYRASQVWEWIFKRKTLDFEQMSNLPRELQETLKSNFNLLPTLERVSVSRDSTEKYLWRMGDGELIESVLLHYLTSRKNWVSVCISTQAGCPVKCSFCQTGLGGFRRNLTRGEILAQIVGMEIESGVQVSRVLFMGMGEPLLNLKATLGAIETLTHERGCNFGGRKITLSTVGPVELEDFVKSDVRVEVAYSLHSPDENIRKRLIAYSRLLSIERALSLLEEYWANARRIVSIEYLMLEGINDLPEHARKLAKLLYGRPFLVNLLPLNPASQSPFMPSIPGKIRQFKQILQESGISATIRKPKGLDIEAACGQLRLKTLDEAS